MPFPHKLPRLFTTAFLVACLVFTLVLEIDAKSRKGGRVSARAGTKSRAVAKSGRGRGSRRSIVKRNAGLRSNTGEDQLGEDRGFGHVVVPDRIEVIENGSADSTELARLFNLPTPKNPVVENNSPTDLSTPARRRNVRIDPSRVLEIQQALARHGFLSGEMTGVYDEVTIEAMRRFQARERIPVTGYPTAHALKRLGLAD